MHDVYFDSLDESLNLVIFLFQDHRQCERRDWKEAVDHL